MCLRWYWAANESGRRTWFQLSRIGDEVFEITARSDSWDEVLAMGNGNADRCLVSSNATHVTHARKVRATDSKHAADASDAAA